MARKVKIEVNDNLTSIFNYIYSYDGYINWHELIQYCIDYQLYLEFYLNFEIIKTLVNEHNLITNNLKVKKI